MLDGRVKTLHPNIHAGLLADRRNPEHVRQLQEQAIEPFDLLVVGLYPFRETVASGAGHDDVIEKIDIGGPAMMRAAAKNFESVGGGRGSGTLRRRSWRRSDANGGLSRETRRSLAAAAFAHTAAYDAAVADWFAQPDGRGRRAARRSSGSPTRRSASCATGRTRTSAGALYREAGANGSPERRERPAGQGDVLQQLAGRLRGVRPGRRARRGRRRHREAQQPVRRRGARARSPSPTGPRSRATT